MGLHHLTLKAAVAKYGALNGTMPVEALKAEIAKDEKAFGPDEVDEIYNTIINPYEEEKATLFPADASAQPNSEVQPADAVVETPEWVAQVLESNHTLLVSNQAVIDSNELIIESNQAVIDALTELKDRASRIVGNYQAEIQKREVPEYDPEMDYHVADGKEFRAPHDFTTIHREGDNVNHLGAEKLQSLLNQGLVVEIDPED